MACAVGEGKPVPEEFKPALPSSPSDIARVSAAGGKVSGLNGEGPSDEGPSDDSVDGEGVSVRAALASPSDVSTAEDLGCQTLLASA